MAASVENANRGKAFGLEGLGDNLGAFMGPPLGVFLLATLHMPLRAVFYLATIPGLLAVAWWRRASLIRPDGGPIGSVDATC